MTPSAMDRRGIDPRPIAARHRGRTRYGIALALFALGWMVLGWPWLSGAVTIPWDAKAHWQPHIQFLAASLARGEVPFWAPQVFAGAPEVADPQSALFSLPFLLLASVDGAPSFRALDTTVLAVAGLGGLSVLAIFRDRGWHWAAGVVAALGFTFGGSMAWRVQHIGQVQSLAFLAIAFWLLERALIRRKVGWGVACGVAAGLMLVGRDQVALLGAYVLTARVLWHWIATLAGRESGFSASLVPAVCAGLVGILVAAWPVWLSAQLAAGSNRPAIDLAGAGAGSLHPALLLTALVPDLYAASGPMADYWGPPSFAWPDTGLFLAQNMGVLYLGAIPAALLLGPGLLRGGVLSPAIAGAALGLAVMLLYALGWYTPVFAQAYAVLPGVDLFRRPADATFLAGGAAAVVGGYLLHRVLGATERAASRRWMLVYALLAALLVAIVAALAHELGRSQQAARPLLASAATFALAMVVLVVARQLQPARPLLAGLVVVLFTIADLAFHNGPNGATGLPPAAYDVLRPSSANETVAALKDRLAGSTGGGRRDRVEIAGLGFAWQNAALVHGFEQTLGYNPVRLADYAIAVAPEDAIAVPEQRRFTPAMPSYRSLMADLLGLRWIVTSVPVEMIDTRLAPGDLRLVGRTADGFIYENPHALPRVLFASRALKVDLADVLRTGRWPDFDPRQSVLLDLDADAPDIDASLPMGEAAIEIRTYAGSRVIVTLDAPYPGYVVLNDVWHPWWAATVDGEPVPLFKANGLFRAVAVPAGQHRIMFEFRPWAATAAALGNATRAVLELRLRLR